MAISALSIMRRPTNVTRRPAWMARSATRCIRGIEVAKQETRTRPGVAFEDCLEGGDDGFLALGEPLAARRWCCRTAERGHRGAPRGEALHVRAFVGRRRGVDLEVAAHHTTPAGVSIARARRRGRCGPRGSGGRGTVRSRRACRARGGGCRRGRRAPTRRVGAKPRVSGVPKTGAGAASRAQPSAPMWSSCPWVRTMPAEGLPCVRRGRRSRGRPSRPRACRRPGREARRRRAEASPRTRGRGSSVRTHRVLREGSGGFGVGGQRFILGRRAFESPVQSHELHNRKCLWSSRALDIEEPQVFLEVSIAILQVVFKGSSASREGLLDEPLEARRGGGHPSLGLPNCARRTAE